MEIKSINKYHPQIEELKKSYLRKTLKGYIFLNSLLFPACLNGLMYFVYFSKGKVIYEMLTNREKIKYIFQYGTRLSLIYSILILPLFIVCDDKAFLTYRFSI